MNVRQILLRHIRVDGGTQARAKMDDEAITEYAEAMGAGASFPPIVVFEDKENLLWLGDGFHRVAGAELAGKKNIKAEIKPGGLREARLYAIGANLTHGLRRSNADKRLAVSMLLDDPEWGVWSNREIARVAGVDHQFVNNMRSERVATVATPAEEKPAPKEKPDSTSFDPAEPGERECAFPDTEHRGPTDQDRADWNGTQQLPAPVERALPPQVARLWMDKVEDLKKQLEAKDVEIAEARERLKEMADQLQEAQAENESLHRILDAEDLLKEFKKEVHRNQELARVTQSRNDGLMSENFDLTQRLKSAQRKIERLERKTVVEPVLDEVG